MFPDGEKDLTDWILKKFGTDSFDFGHRADLKRLLQHSIPRGEAPKAIDPIDPQLVGCLQTQKLSKLAIGELEEWWLKVDKILHPSRQSIVKDSWCGFKEDGGQDENAHNTTNDDLREIIRELDSPS